MSNLQELTDEQLNELCRNIIIEQKARKCFSKKLKEKLNNLPSKTAKRITITFDAIISIDKKALRQHIRTLNPSIDYKTSIKIITTEGITKTIAKVFFEDYLDAYEFIDEKTLNKILDLEDEMSEELNP